MENARKTEANAMSDEWPGSFAGNLRDRAEEAEGLRRLPEATIAEAAAAGYFKLLVPKRFGGCEVGFSRFMDIVRQLAQGCTSSAWTLSFLALHAWVLCKFEPELQEELFAGGRIPLAPAPLAPSGEAIAVDGGYRVNGRWEWASGVMHANWAIVCGNEANALGPRFCVLPIDDVTIEDNWRVAGMAATGCNAIRIDGAFVPRHRTIAALRLRLEKTPGELFHDCTTIAYPMAPTLALVAATPALGATEGAIEAYINRMKEKTQAFSGIRQSELAPTHLRLGEAIAAARAARSIWKDAVSTLEEIGPLGYQAPIDGIARIRLAAADIVRMANVAINGLAAAAGASLGYLSSPLQRALRDVQMIRGHVMYDWDRTAQIAGRLALGFEPVPADLL